MSTPLETRRRRAIYRAAHRGTKEMDHLLGRYVLAHIPAMTEAEIDRLEQLMTRPDPELHAAILDPSLLGDREMAPLIRAIRRFHGLDALEGKLT